MCASVTPPLFVPDPRAAIRGSFDCPHHHLHLHWHEDVEQSNSWADEFDKEGGDGKTREREKGTKGLPPDPFRGHPSQDGELPIQLIPMVILISAMFAFCWLPLLLLINVVVDLWPSVASWKFILYIW